MVNKAGNPNMKKGAPSVNAKGRKSVYEDYNDRAMFFLNKYTAEKIIGLVRNFHLPTKTKPTAEQLAYHKEIRKLPGRDLSILMSLAKGFTMEGSESYRELLVRALGKPPKDDDGKELTLNLGGVSRLGIMVDTVTGGRISYDSGRLGKS